MGHKLIEQVLERTEKAKEDSDFSYFFTLLNAGEALIKTITFGMLAAITDDKDRNRYRLEYDLVRNNSPGDCGKVLDDILTGPASQHLLQEARVEQTELTKYHQTGDWQCDSVLKLKEAFGYFNIQSESLPAKVNLNRWIRLFATLRNKTRGHGAPQSDIAGKAAIPLSESIRMIYTNFHLFQRTWAYLYRNLSGKYRVSFLGNQTKVFDYLKKEKIYTFENGIYIWFGKPKYIPFILSDPELNDFFVANGSFNDKRYELLSYNTGDREQGDSSKYLPPPGALPESETQGRNEFELKGNCFSNVPEPAIDYIDRPDLEKKLFDLLMDKRREVVTLHGAGGIGKTSLTLQVVKKLYDEKRYVGIVWFSARDIDLLSDSIKIKQVQPDVFSQKDIAKYYTKLIFSEDKLNDKKFNCKVFFENELKDSKEFKNCLFIFDNFETIQNPSEMFEWIDSFIRSPNKILITTRLSDFRGDYPLEVSGMTEEESKQLINQTAGHLDIDKSLVCNKTQKIISLSQGHPYIIKILMGELKLTKDITKALSTQDRALTALFERTYANLTPCAQYTFMVLACWNSKVPKTALEAVLMASSSKEKEEIEDIGNAIESLYRYSLIQKIKTEDQQEFIELPFTAKVFGEKKLKIHPLKSKVKEDVKLLQMFGSVGQNDMSLNLYNRLEEFIKNVSNYIDNGESFEKYESILDVICQIYNPGRILLARFYMEQDSTDSNLKKAENTLNLFLQDNSNEGDAIQAWIMLSKIYKQRKDHFNYIHTLNKVSQFDTTYFWKISNAANEINMLLRNPQLDISTTKKLHLIQPILDILEKRKSEAKADDFSRMAWLALHIQQHIKAKEYVVQGLKLDSQNQHCLKLKDNLES